MADGLFGTRGKDRRVDAWMSPRRDDDPQNCRANAEEPFAMAMGELHTGEALFPRGLTV